MGWFDDTGTELGIDPQLMGGNTGVTGGAGDQPPPNIAPQFTPQAAAPPQQGKSWNDWIDATYGRSASRGGGFADSGGTSLQDAIARYNTDTGGSAKYIGGPSGDLADFGHGTQDALTAGGQFWLDPNVRGAGGSGGGGGEVAYNNSGGLQRTMSAAGGGAPTMPAAPTVQTLDAPAPFASTVPQLGTFQGPAAAAAPGQVSYTNMTAPGALTPTQLPTQAGGPKAAPGQTQWTPAQTQAEIARGEAAGADMSWLKQQQAGGYPTKTTQTAGDGLQTQGPQGDPRMAALAGGTGPDPQLYGGGRGAPIGGDPAQLVGGTSSSSTRGDGVWSSGMESGGAPAGGAASGGLAQLSYTPGATPTAFSGSRQATPGALSYENLATPADYAHQDYKAPTAEEMAADPSYQFRLKQGQDALQNSAAAKGMLRGGNTAKALIDYGQGAASQEYAAIDARARATNAANNAGQLGAHQTNAQTGLAYGQDRNSNALQFGQANINNAAAANSDNYARSATEAQQGFANQNTVEQQNNEGRNRATQGNITNAQNATNANNATNLAYGNQNFNQAFAVNQANNAGNANATTTNNQANQAAQAQQYGQASNTYNTNAAAQAQNYGQQLGTYSTNTGTALAYNQNANQNALANYGAATNAALGYGNLNLGYQNSNNAYALGQGNLALGQGQLGVSQGQLGLQQQGQQYNQDLSTFLTNYQVTNSDPWNRNYQLAQLGQPVRPD